MSPAKRRGMLIAAGALFIIALVWLIMLNAKSPVRAVCARLTEHGYHITPGDLYTQSCASSASIREVLQGTVENEEIDELAELSRRFGFDGDVDKVGKVQLCLWQKDDDSVLIIYMTDETPELVFINRISTGEAEPIG